MVAWGLGKLLSGQFAWGYRLVRDVSIFRSGIAQGEEYESFWITIGVYGENEFFDPVLVDFDLLEASLSFLWRNFGAQAPFRANQSLAVASHDTFSLAAVTKTVDRKGKATAHTLQEDAEDTIIVSINDNLITFMVKRGFLAIIKSKIISSILVKYYNDLYKKGKFL